MSILELDVKLCKLRRIHGNHVTVEVLIEDQQTEYPIEDILELSDKILLVINAK